MTNREGQLLKDKIDIALICLSHAIEEPMSAETYIHIAMDELDIAGKYVHERLSRQYYMKEVEDETD